MEWEGKKETGMDRRGTESWPSLKHPADRAAARQAARQAIKSARAAPGKDTARGQDSPKKRSGQKEKPKQPLRGLWPHSIRPASQTRPTPLQDREKNPPERGIFIRLGRLDSNQDPQIQSLVCCHCTTPQSGRNCITAPRLRQYQVSSSSGARPSCLACS